MVITGLSDPVMANTDMKLICTIIRIKPKAGGLFGINFITASQLSCGKVMFSVMCVGHCPCDYLLMMPLVPDLSHHTGTNIRLQPQTCSILFNLDPTLQEIPYC